jgi:hypothetical protein
VLDLSTKIDFNSLYASEKIKYDSLSYKESPLTTTGNLSFTSLSSGLSYNSTTGENGLAILFQNLFASCNITASEFNAKAEGADLTALSNSVAASLAEMETDINNNISKSNLLQDIKGTTQTPTYTNGDITSIAHKDANLNVIRTDTFVYTDTLITETRAMTDGSTLVLKYYFNGDGSYNRTEVI